ncbi:protein PALS1-like isoform X2 [Mya arenaria]|uniref:protein PALS1-like isoform X2 n=1 Tax=Mya arenaria TaxID=6604 RepID=UPI0022DEDB60|nr:protein PALS1-like isoform X2 [Mya arenaria]
MVSSFSPYSTVMDLSLTSELDNESPSNTFLRSQSLHGKQLPGNASGDYANLGPTGSLEDFHNFTNGYDCTSSRFGSLETLTRKKPPELDPFSIKVKGEAASPPSASSNAGSTMFFEIEQAMEENDEDEGSPVEHFENLTIIVKIPPMEQKFGFSVSGGCDESFPPRVDSISKGSPAECASLLVGDEIVEVNGQSLDNASHAEVIAYIHKCIRSKTINLRVKRSKKKEVAVSSENVQNAYIVAVEEDAKRRLEELLYNHKLTPIDMTKHVGVESEDKSGDSNDSLDLSIERAVFQSSMPYMSQPGHMTNGHVEMAEVNGFKDGKKSKGKKGKRGGSNETPMIDNLLTDRMSSQNSLNNDSFDDIHSSVEFDPEKHREMAIDVPKNFQGTAKTPPRLPSSTHSSERSTPVKESAKMGKSYTNNAYSDDHLERIRHHQEEIRKRQEREEQRVKEQEFLRASLRRSEKMRSLQKERNRQQQAGVDNTAYADDDDDDDDSGGFEEGYVSGRHTQNSRDYMKKNIGYNDIHAMLQHMKGAVHSKEGREKLKFLNDFFDQKQFQNAVSVHHQVLDVKTRSPPVQCECQNSREVRADSVEVLCSVKTPATLELLSILNKPQVKELLLTHDRVGQIQAKSSDDREPPEGNGEIPANVPDTASVIRIVHLDKTTEPLGATVRNDGESVIISRIVKGGTAEKSGMLHEGDEILDINGIDMKGKDINDVSEMLANMTGRITFTIYPSNEYNQPNISSGIMHVKALFNYDPEDDLYIPCRELGLSFSKCDILHVINQEDSNWWQAYREGEEDYQSLAGLIPSRSFHEQREQMRLTIGTENKENQKKGRSCSCGRANKKKKKRKQREDQEEALSYLEVAQYYPEPNRRRPIVLIGPPNVGRQELRQRLMESDFERFAAAVPHTSRTMKVPGAAEEPELDGKDYHFVSRAEFQNDIHAGKFIEHGEFERSLYGTSVDAVRQVISSGKICVLNTDPEALYMLYETDLKPYVIFVYPSNIEKLRLIHHRLGLTNVKDDDLRDIIERAREMEDKFGHMFDYILVNQDMDKAFDELVTEINRIEVEPQWVPVEWTR